MKKINIVIFVLLLALFINSSVFATENYSYSVDEEYSNIYDYDDSLSQDREILHRVLAHINDVGSLDEGVLNDCFDIMSEYYNPSEEDLARAKKY